MKSQNSAVSLLRSWGKTECRRKCGMFLGCNVMGNKKTTPIDGQGDSTHNHCNY